AAGVELQHREQVNYFIVKSDARVVGAPGAKIAPPPEPVEGAPTRETDRPAREAAVDRQPEGITWIYSFQDSRGDLHITNSYGRIPEDLRDAVNRIAIFPVRYLAATARGNGLVLRVGDEQLKMALADVELPAGLLSAAVHDYLDGILQGELLRLKFNPQRTSPDGLVYGRLYLPDGICVNHDFVRRGLGRCCLENTPPEEHEALRKAEERARSEKVGMWSDPPQN
ncbi:MAG: thermonuclease family protein, partial [Desulfobacterales bacterium]|nr:thermonuclease family protein [Desulfobacterales bacterium]